MKDHPEFIALGKKCKAKKIAATMHVGSDAIIPEKDRKVVPMHKDLGDIQPHLDKLAQEAKKTNTPIMIKFDHPV